jgi:peroxiredoxin family protein
MARSIKPTRENDMAADDPEIVREALFEVIENQIRDETPAETKRTYNRLIANDYSHEETMKLIACVLTTEIFEMLKHREFFNEARYSAALQALPEYPWVDEEE